MNRKFKSERLQDVLLPLRIDSFTDTGQTGIERYFVEYDGLHFTGSTMKSVMNKVLKYIFVGGEE